MKDLQIIRAKELQEILSVSGATLWRMGKAGELPEKVKISDRAVGWLKSDIQDWLESKKVKA